MRARRTHGRLSVRSLWRETKEAERERKWRVMAGEMSWTDCATQVSCRLVGAAPRLRAVCLTGDGGEGGGVVYGAGHRERDQTEEHETRHAPVSPPTPSHIAYHQLSSFLSLSLLSLSLFSSLSLHYLTVFPVSMPANEACRSLRSCLRHHAKKENGRFVRKNSSTLIQYALRKVSSSTSPLRCM